MAITDAYATSAEYREMLGRVEDSNDDTIGDDLVAASRFIDRICNQFFTKDTSGVARIFLPREKGDAKIGFDTATLFLPPMAAAPSEVIIDEDGDGSFADETALASTDFEATPRNALIGPEVKPYYAIRLTDYGDYGRWSPNLRVRVTAEWGWPSVPMAIKRACVELVGLIRLETPRATVNVVEGFEGLTSNSAEAQGIVNRLVKSYRRRSY